MAGYALNQNELDQRMGRAVTNLRDALDEVVAVKALLDDTTLLPDATLTALGYSSGDITTIRASFADLVALYKIAHAQQQQVGNNDFFFNAKHLAGAR